MSTHIEPEYLKRLTEIANTPSIKVNDIEIGEQLLLISDTGLQYRLLVLSHSSDLTAAKLEFEGPYNSDMFLVPNVQVLLAGSCKTINSTLIRDQFLQGFKAEILVPYSNLPIIHPPNISGIFNHIAVNQVQVLGGLINTIHRIRGTEQIPIDQQQDKEPMPKFPDSLSTYVITESEIIEECKKLDISLADIYNEYIDLQERYAIGLKGKNTERSVYKFGVNHQYMETVKHIIWLNQKALENARAQNDYRSIRFNMLRIATFKWWTNQLDNGSYISHELLK